MASSPHSSIGSNHADHGAQQTNIIQFIFCSAQACRSETEVMLDSAIEAFTRDKPPIRNPEGARFLRGQVASPFSSTIPRSINHSSTRYCFLADGALAESSCFDRDRNRCLARYPNPESTKSVIEILKKKDVQVLSTWIRSHKSSVLLLNRYGSQNGRSDRTADCATDLTLEIMGRINQFNNNIGANLKTSAVVAHFCGEQARGEQWTQNLVIQDFLVQLRRDRKDHLVAHHSCEPLGQAEDIFHIEAKRPSELWDLLSHCIAKAGIKSLFILLDKVDSIHSRVSSNKFQDFLINLQQILDISQEGGVPIKLLLTRRSPRIALSFQNTSQITLDHPSHHRSRT